MTKLLLVYLIFAISTDVSHCVAKDAQTTSLPIYALFPITQNDCKTQNKNTTTTITYQDHQFFWNASISQTNRTRFFLSFLF